MLNTLNGGRTVSLVAAMKVQSILLLCVVAVALCDGSNATLEQVQNLTVSVTPATNTLTIAWEDTKNVNFTDLSYQISYTVSARTVELLTNVMMSFDSNENGTYSVTIQNETYFVSGVTVSVSVLAVNGTEEGPVSGAMDVASGIFAPPVVGLQAVPDSIDPTVNLTWSIPFIQVPPDSYMLTFTATLLSGIVPLTVAEATNMTSFFDNETSSSGVARAFVITNLRYYSMYAFELTAVYGSDNSTAENTVTNVTAVGIPTAPNNVAVTSGIRSLTVTWTAPDTPNAPTVNYSISYTSVDSVSSTNVESDIADTTFELTGLAAFTEYEVMVQACTSLGCGPFSDVVISRTLEEAPSAPANVTVIEIASTYAVFQWEAPESPNGVIRQYILSLTDSRDSSIITVNVTNTSDLTANVTGLDPFVQYWVTVSAETVAIGEGSSNFSFTTRQGIPSPAQNVQTINNITHIIVTWSPPDTPNGIVNYSVEIRETNLLTNQTTKEFEAMVVTDLFYVLEYSVRPYSRYTVSVTSQTAAGMGESEMDSFDTPEEAPSSAQNLTVTYNTTNIFITWVMPVYPNGVVNYTVIVSERDLLSDSSAPPTIIKEEVITELELLVDYMVKPYHEYFVSVTSQTSAGMGETVMESFVTPEDVPSSAQNVTASNNDTHIIIMWEAPATPNGRVSYTIRVEVRDLLTGDVTIIHTEVVTGTVTKLIVEVQIKAYSVYTICVTSQTSAGMAAKVTVSFMTPEKVPSSAQNVRASNNDYKTIIIMWEAPATPNGLVSYTVKVEEIYLLTTEVTIIHIETVTGTVTVLIVEVQIKAYSVYNICVTSQTSAGMAEAVTVSFMTPEKVPSSAQNMTASNNDTHINIMWEAPATPNGRVNYTVEVEERDLLTGNISIIHTEVVTGTELTVQYEVEPYSMYNVSVTSQTSAGMAEAVTVSFTTPEEVPSPAQNVMVSVNDSFIFVTWSSPSMPNGVVSYTVVVQERELLFDVSTTVATELVSGGQLFLNVTITTKPYTEYTAIVTSQTTAGQGQSANGSVVTPEEIPCPVRNLTISVESNATLVVVEWEDSACPNGNVTYVVLVTCIDEATLEMLFADVFSRLFGQDLRIEMPDPGPYVNCTAAVIASNSAGNSSESREQVVTPQGESEAPQNLMTTPTNISVLVEWDAPRDPNGVIFNYQVNLLGSAGTLLNSTRISNLSLLQVMFLELMPYTDYSVEIRALTGSVDDEIVGEVASDSFRTSIGIPTAPNDVAVTSGIRSLTVTWTAPDTPNAPTVNYSVSYTSVDSVSSTNVESDIADTTFELTGLAAYTEYEVMVQACTSLGCGPFSDVVMNRTLEEAPSVPLNVEAVFVNSTTISVSWDVPEFTNGIIRNYTLTYNITSGFGSPGATATGDNSTSILIDSLTPFTTYNIFVAGVTVEEGLPSSVVVMTNESAPTAEPQQLMASVVNARNLTISWDPPPSDMINGIIRTYNVRYSLTTSSSPMEPSTDESVPGNETSLMVTGLNPFANYTFEVLAVTVGLGPSASITVQTEQAAPSAPTITEAVNTSSTSIRVAWTPPLMRNGMIRGYVISYWPSDGSGTILEKTVNYGQANMTELTNLMIFTSYNISVLAVTNERGEPSEVVTVTTNEDTPLAPQNLVAIELNSTAVMVTWSAPLTPNGIITHYFVNYTSINGNVTISEEISIRMDAMENVLDYELVLTNLTEFTTYRIQVTASTRIGEGEVSEVTVDTDPAMSSPPTSLSAVPINSTSILLSWGYPLFPRGEISGYIINFGAEEINVTLDVRDDMSNQSLIVGSLLPFTEYTFSVAAYAFHEGEVIVGATSQFSRRTLQAAPSAPQSFTVSTVSQMPTRLSASWMAPQTANGIITFYTISCRENGTMDEFVTTVVSNGQATTAIISGLSPFTVYECFVTANTSAGEGDTSNFDTAQTDEDAPSAPQSFTVTIVNQTPTNLSASWMAPQTANGIITSYTISCRENGTMDEFVTTVVNDGLATTVIISGLSPFTVYECFATANTSAGEGDRSNVDTARTDEDAPDQPPQNINAFFLNSTSIRVEWAPPPEDSQNGIIRSYTVKYSLAVADSSMPEMITITIGAENRSVDITQLEKFTEYDVQVSAVTVAVGPPATVTVRTDSDIPSQPLNVIILPDSVTARSFNVTWSPPSDINSPGVNYTLRLTSPSRNVTGIMEEMFTLEELMPFTNYTVIVVAVSERGPGPDSDSVSVTTDEDVPTEPLNFTLETIPGSPTQLLARWSPPSPTNGMITNYTVRCTSDTLPPSSVLTYTTVLTEVIGNDFSLTLSNLTPFTNYSCNVSASTVAGQGLPSVADTAQTDESVPGVPEQFMAVDIQAQVVSFTWMPPSITNGVITNYTLTYFNTTDNLSITIEANMLTVNVESLNEFTGYTFELRAATRIGLGEPATVNLTTAQAAPSAAPLNLTGAFNDSDSIRISWLAPPLNDQNGEIISYLIIYERTDGKSDALFMEITNDTSFLITFGLMPFTNYSIAVAARTIDLGPDTDPVVIATDSALPTAPRNVNFSERTIRSIFIEWLAPDPTNGEIERYEINVTQVDASENMFSFPMRPPDVLEYNITGLMEYVEYRIVVFAFTDKGPGMGSNPIVVRTLEHHPDEPTNFRVSVVNSTALMVTWGPPADPNGIILSYHLYIDLSPEDAAYLSEDSRENNISNTSLSYTVGGLQEYAIYTLRLAASTSAGIGNVTEPITMTTNEAAPSSRVVNITASVIQTDSITLRWTPPLIRDWNGVLTIYTISYTPVQDCTSLSQLPNYVNNGFETEAAANSNPRTAFSESQDSPLVETTTVDNLEEFVSYLFSIDVETSEGRSPMETGCFMTMPSVPEAPTILTFTTISNTSASVSWEALPPIDHNGILLEYVVNLTNTNTSTTTATNVSTSESNYTLNGLVPFTMYSVRVSATNQVGTGMESGDEMTMTNEGVPEIPLELKAVAINTTIVEVTWSPPSVSYGVLGNYYVTYYVESKSTEPTPKTTANTNIQLTGLNGNINYIIEVTASTGAGQGEASSTSVKTPAGPSPVVTVEDHPEIAPMVPMTEVTSNSFVVQFNIVPEQEVNGPVDKYWIYVQRQPSENENIGTWYESNQATGNWPQYASVEKTTERSTSGRKRQTEGDMQTVTVGGSEDCGPTDMVCNGPLTPGSDYRVRYRLFSGNNSVDYDFTGQTFTTSPARDNNIIVIAVVVCLVLLVILVVIAVVLIAVYIKKRRAKGEFKVSKYKSKVNGDQVLLPRNESGTTMPFLGPSDPGIVPIHEMKEGGTPLRASEPRFPRHIQNTKIYLKDFTEHLKRMLDDSNYKFSEEYERVTEIGLEHAKEASLMAENRAKNRYTNILAYDHSRVKLSFVDDEPGSDYINASYIPGHRMRRAYVATQGPLPATFDDFWRMVWEQNTHIIVMLTQLVERGRTKCHRYWPGTEPSVYGDIAVEMMSEKEKEDWTIREFRLSVPDRRSRLVRHYQFTSWPDHGVPDSPMAALDFVKSVRSQVEPHHGPLVVHCSAGVGRTGCFIALDTLQQNVRDHDWVDVYGLACEMRQHRNHMIQTEAQYVFIHKSMQEIIDTMAVYGTGVINNSSHFPKAGYSSVICNPFADEASATQMSDYYNDFLSEETHM